MRRRFLVVLVVALTATALAGPALAAASGNSPISNTTTRFDEVVSFEGTDPCNPSNVMWVTERDTGSIHEMVFADGTMVVSGGFRADFEADADGDGVYDIAGRYRLNFAETGGTATFTWNGEYWYLDGGPSTRFHWTYHTATPASGDPMHELFRSRCW